MATDNSPPRIRIILTTAFSALVILVTLKYVFDSYFLMMTDEVEHEHLRAPEELLKLHEGEQRNLASTPIPIDRAMQEIAAKGREASPDIAPQPSNDMGPMVGWIRNPNQAVIEKLNAQAAAAAATPDAGTPAVASGDGGVAASAGDAGAPHPAAALPDAGGASTHKAAPEDKKHSSPTTATPDGGAH